jgi:hypothetical protein
MLRGTGPPLSTTDVAREFRMAADHGRTIDVGEHRIFLLSGQHGKLISTARNRKQKTLR